MTTLTHDLEKAGQIESRRGRIVLRDPAAAESLRLLRGGTAGPPHLDGTA